MLNIAIRAARSAGDQLIRSADNVVGKLRINYKESNDVAAEIEHRVAHEIIQNIGNAYPEHCIATKNSTAQQQKEYTWLIDPINGINNFMHGFPQYAISIALKVHNKFEVAVIFDPLKDELYTASRGGGAMLNNRKIRVSREHKLNKSLLAAGLSSNNNQYLDEYLAILHALYAQTAGVRQTGSTALDMAALACGRIDGCLQIGLDEYTMGAGILLVQEAGGVITDFSFNDQYLKTGHLVAGQPRMQQNIYQVIETRMKNTSN